MMVSRESVRFISQIDAPSVPSDKVATVMLALNHKNPESKSPAWCRSSSGTRSIPLQRCNVSCRLRCLEGSQRLTELPHRRSPSIERPSTSARRSRLISSPLALIADDGCY